MFKVWEKIDSSELSKPNNWALLKFSLRIKKIFRLNDVFAKNPKNFKFPPFKKEETLFKISKLVKILRLKDELKCEFLSDRTLLIKKK